MQVSTLCWLAVVLAAAAVPARGDTRADGTIAVGDFLEDDLYAAGRRALITGAIGGDAVLAAGSIDVSGDIMGDAILAAGRVAVSGGVGDDLRAAGGEVTLRGFVTDHAVIAGRTVMLAPESAVAGRTWVMGREVVVAGELGDDLRVTARSAIIGGRLEGNVEVAAQDIRVEPGTFIAGNLIWRSEQAPVIPEDARIMGEVVAAGEYPEAAPVSGGGGASGGLWVQGLALFIAAAGLLWLLPNTPRRAARRLRTAPVRTLATGFAALVLAPVVTVLLFVSLVGWLFGLLLMAGYGFALVLAGLLGLLMAVELVLGGIGLEETPGRWRRLLVLVPVVIAVLLLQAVPVAGTLALALLLLAGLGALVGLFTGWRDRVPTAG